MTRRLRLHRPIRLAVATIAALGIGVPAAMALSKGPDRPRLEPGTAPAATESADDANVGTADATPGIDDGAVGENANEDNSAVGDDDGENANEENGAVGDDDGDHEDADHEDATDVNGGQTGQHGHDDGDVGDQSGSDAGQD